MPNFGVKGSKVTVHHKQHAENGMANVKQTLDRESCSKALSFSMEGSNMAICCKQNNDDDMKDGTNRRCARNGWSKQSKTGVDNK